MSLKKLTDWLTKQTDIDQNSEKKEIENKKDWTVWLPTQQIHKVTQTVAHWWDQKPKIQWPIRHNNPNKPNNPQHRVEKKVFPKQNFSRWDWKKLRIIPIWWFEEVWKNSMIIEYWDDIIIIDCWMQFAEHDMLWIDYVIPDFSYLENKKDKIKWIIITHWHLDHIWALPHILPKLNFPKVYATKLTNWLSKKRVEEFWILQKCRFIDINHTDIFKLWVFEVKPFRVNHSIPDWVWLRIKTPNGSIVHTWDFKFDFSPADWCQTDYARIAEIWWEWVVAAFVDSTNSWKEWFIMSEKVVWEALEKIIREADWRIIMALFSTLIWRISQIVDFSQKYWRQIFLSWKSLVNNIEIAQDLGYIRKPRWVIQKLSDEVNKLPHEKVLILCTWSQWEDLSALARIARDDHSIIEVHEKDTVVVSASPIIWNERDIYNVIDQLTAKWAKVITNTAMDVHTSGHAAQWELMLMYSLLRPKYLVPIHGELHMRVKHKELINERLSHSNDNIPILFNWSVLEIDSNWEAKILKDMIRCDTIMVDWLWVWDIWTAVIKERQMMAENGALIALYHIDKKSKTLVEKPEIISRWFIYVKESKTLVEEIKSLAEKLYNETIISSKDSDIKSLRKIIANWLARFTDKKIKRIPMILPIFVYV